MSNSNGDHVLAHIQQFYPGYHPLVSIAHIAHDPESDLRLKYECHKTISKFVTPELRSIEVNDQREDDNRVVISLFEDDAFEEPKTLDHIVDADYEPC
ncbi:MAG: hypothetical protein LC687_05390 [Actinobacteria bacterium]|nr:hypothetical protein [Actinomycetota bacterium]